jgi:hypothetical protein
MGKGKAAPGTWVERDMFESSAFLSLKGFAPQLLIFFLSKRRIEMVGPKGKQKRTCVNCDNLCVTYVELEKLGVSRPRITKGLDDLLAKGFLNQIHAGGAYRKDKSIYALSDKWRLWTPGAVFGKRVRDVVRRGYQGGK